MRAVADYSLFEFLELPAAAVADLVRGLTVAFPIDGTRRWFMLHHPELRAAEDYMRLTGEQYVAVFKMMFDHGADTILVPAFGGELLSRGESYVRQTMGGMAHLARDAHFTDFYREYGVRVRFYGDWRRQLAGLPGAAELTRAFEECSAAHHAGTRRILYGIYADDMLAGLADDLAHGRVAPAEFTREGLVAHYYGEYVKPADLYIGFGRPIVFDVPALVGAQTDLYYPVVPSLDLDARLFRMLLWDHYAGRWTQQEWDGLSTEDFDALRAFYAAHHERVLGMGAVDGPTGIWFPQGLRAIDAFRKPRE